MPGGAKVTWAAYRACGVALQGAISRCDNSLLTACAVGGHAVALFLTKSSGFPRPTGRGRAARFAEIRRDPPRSDGAVQGLLALLEVLCANSGTQYLPRTYPVLDAGDRKYPSAAIRSSTNAPKVNNQVVHSPDPIPALKQQLANELIARLDGWTQDYAGALISAHPCRVSNLRNGRLEPFSLERLIRFVARTKGTVTIHVAWTRHYLYLPRPRIPRPGATPGTTR